MLPWLLVMALSEGCAKEAHCQIPCPPTRCINSDICMRGCACIGGYCTSFDQRVER
jgi:hypothetical protein